MQNYHVFISGQVQGVSFRYRAQEKAARFRVAGWIRNTNDGRVEIEVEGDEKAVEQFIAWCRRGPMFARVESVDLVSGDPKGFESFEIIG